MAEAQGGYDLVELALFVESCSQAQGGLEIQSPDFEAQGFKPGLVDLR